MQLRKNALFSLVYKRLESLNKCSLKQEASACV